jgi:YYY domain-containing protein
MDISMILNLLSWYVAIFILGLVTFPLAYRLLEKLPDRGYALSRILGLLLWGFVFWLLGNLRFLQNNPGGILFAFTVLAALSVWSGWGHWQEIWRWMKQNHRLILMTELVFLVGFVFMALVRGSDPDATGTEKPMELAFINAIMRSQTFPPHDPWLSGYAISYYHFGYILTGMLATITAVSGGVAFNSMLIAVFAMSAGGAYGVLYNLLVVFRKTLTHRINHHTWALLGPIFLLFVSNIEAVFEMLHQAGVGWDLETGTSHFWEWVNIHSLRTPPQTPLGLVPQRFWWWWQASRVVHDIDLLGNVSGLSPIDEFPAFSFVLGDLHPHVLVIPFVMLLVGLALNIYLGGMTAKVTLFGFRLPYRIDLFVLSGITLGGIAFLNTWDLPVYFALLVGAYTLRQVWVKGWDWGRLTDLLILAIPLGILSLVLYAPFYISFQSQVGGMLPNLIYPTRGFYLWVMFAPLFIPVFLFFGWLWRKKLPGEWKWASILVVVLIVFLYLVSIGLGFHLAQTEQGQQVIQSQGETTYGGLVLSALMHRARFGVSLMTLALLLVSGLAYLMGHFNLENGDINPHNPVPFVLLMVLLGGMMVLVPEFIFLRDVFGARMNTVFKFYYQAWMLWSLAAAFAGAVLLNRGRVITRVVVVIVVILGLVYPIFAFPTKTNQFQPVAGFTLDASAYLERSQPDEAAAIRWLEKAPLGVVAEAIGGQYSGFARVATHSGQPTVLGWPGHQGQWRGGYKEVGSREGDIRTLYETPDWNTTLAIIQRYDIAYIYIGSLEMSTYAVFMEKFNQNLGSGFSQGSVTVYIVPHTLRQ